MNWEYIAGFFDGEGFVSYSRNRSSPSHSTTGKEGQEFYYPYIGIGNTNRETIESVCEFINKQLDGKFGPVRQVDTREPNIKRTGIKSHKPFYTVRYLHHKSLLIILPELIPRCIIKKTALEKALKEIIEHKWRERRLSKEFLEHFYYIHRLSGKQIGFLTDTPKGSIYSGIHYFKIKSRSTNETKYIQNRGDFIMGICESCQEEWKHLIRGKNDTDK